MIHVDAKYISLVSARLNKFKRTKNNLYNFRCPYCGDSKKNKNKTRAYLYQIKTDFNFRCHNCGLSRSFTNFLKDQDSHLYDQYVMERYKQGLTGKATVTPEPDFKKVIGKPVFKKKINLPLASDVARASLYLKNRKLDPTKFYYTDKFKHFCNTFKPTFDNILYDHPRIVIPMYNENKTLIGFQGRALDGKQQPKYLTIMLVDNHPKVYGLEQIDRTKKVYVTEGPFDSTFIDNSIAMCGSDVDLSNYDFDFTYIYDNEPRNREIVSKIAKTISLNKEVVIFPSEIREKDVNDMYIAGHNVMELVKLNTFNGLKAKLKLQTWKRV